MRLATSAHSGKLPASVVKVACALNVRSLSRASDSRPFMTERMTINAATPSAMPSNEAPVMNETIPLRRRECT